MLTEEQRELRYLGIGGSDAAAAIGENPYKTPVELWLEKTRRVSPADLSDNERVYFGNVLEEIVAQEYARRNREEVRRRSQAYVHPEHEFIRANVDRIVIRTNRILECKTVDKFVKRFWQDGPPEHYRIQCHHNMIASGRRESVLAALVGGNEYEDWEIPHDPVIADAIVRLESEFWKHVIEDTPPPPVKASDVVALYPVDSGKVRIATPELREIHSELMAVRRERKRLQDQEEALAEKVKLFLGPDRDLLLSEGGEVLATWRSSKPRKNVSWETVAREIAARAQMTDELESIALAHTGEIRVRPFLPKEMKSRD